MSYFSDGYKVHEHLGCRSLLSNHIRPNCDALREKRQTLRCYSFNRFHSFLDQILILRLYLAELPFVLLIYYLFLNFLFIPNI